MHTYTSTRCMLHIHKYTNISKYFLHAHLHTDLYECFLYMIQMMIYQAAYSKKKFRNIVGKCGVFWAPQLL